MRQLPADDPRCSLPAGAVPAADRVQPHRPARARVRDAGPTSKWYCTLLGRSRSGGSCSACFTAADEQELVAASDDVCTGLQLVNFLQDVPRDLALGRDLPAGRGPPALRRHRARPAERAADAAAPLRGRARARAARRRASCSSGRSAAGSGGRSACSRGAVWRRSTRSRTRAGTSSRSGRDRPGHGSPGRPWRRSSGDVTVEQAYAEVERLTRRRARNFAYGIGSCRSRSAARSPRSTRSRGRSTTSRTATRCRRREARAGWRRCTRARRRSRRRRCWIALADARRRYPIPGEALHDLVDGGLQDTEQARYADFDELRGYCRRVAGAVGVACIAVYGADQPQRAEAMGIALQLINIMRDVDEDWSLGRVYIPQDELASFGVSRRGHRGRPLHAGLAGADGLPGGPRPRLPRGGADAARLPRPPQRGVRRARSRTSTRRRSSGSSARASTSSARSRACRR